MVGVDPRQTVNNGMIWNNTDIDDAEPSQNYHEIARLDLAWCSFLAVQDSSIGDIVSQSVSNVTFDFTTSRH